MTGMSQYMNLKNCHCVQQCLFVTKITKKNCTLELIKSSSFLLLPFFNLSMCVESKLSQGALISRFLYPAFLRREATPFVLIYKINLYNVLISAELPIPGKIRTLTNKNLDNSISTPPKGLDIYYRKGGMG